MITRENMTTTVVDLTGRVFHNLTVLKRAEQAHPSKRAFWTCECSVCGQLVDVRSDALQNKKANRCHCNKMIETAMKAENHEQIKYTNLRRKAKMRGLAFELEKEDVFELLNEQHYKCAMTDLPIDMNIGSLDRIENFRGYLPDNVQWVHKDVNGMMMDYNKPYFMHMCYLVVKKHPELVQQLVSEMKLQPEEDVLTMTPAALLSSVKW